MSTPHSSLIKRLLSQQRGAITPLFLVTTIGILSTTLGGIDLVRYNVVQSRLQNSLDAATLSAGRNLANLTIKPGEPKTEQWKEDAFEYFRGNMPEDYLGNDILPEDLKISYSEDPLATENYAGGQFIEMEVTGTLPLISTGFLNVSSFNVHAENRAVRKVPTDIELVMALDNTGSMSSGSPSKISVLKTAATDLSTIVFAARDEDESDTPRQINIGLVPFADTVNVGNTQYTRQWLSFPEVQRNFINNPDEGWNGCIVEPPPSTWGGTELPANVLAPSAGFQPLHLTYPHVLTRSDLGLEYDEDKNVYQRVATPPRTPEPAFLTEAQLSTFYLAPTLTSAQQYDRRVWAERVNKDNDKQGKNPVFRIYAAANPSNCISARRSLFLTEDADTIKASIKKMSANGNTIIPTGLLWAWRMLHPTWQGAWDGSARPRNTDPRKLRKVIVLLTDGQNEPADRTSSVSDKDKQHYAAYTLQYDVQTYPKKGYADTPTTTPITFTPTNTTDGSTSGYSSASRPDQDPVNSLKMRNPYSRNGAPNRPANDADEGWGEDETITGALIDEYLTQLCRNVKDDGNDIKIYTVTLGKVGINTEERMNNCSSGAGYFYNTQTVSELPEVFKSIAGALIELRLTR